MSSRAFLLLLSFLLFPIASHASHVGKDESLDDLIFKIQAVNAIGISFGINKQEVLSMNAMTMGLPAALDSCTSVMLKANCSDYLYFGNSLKFVDSDNEISRDQISIDAAKAILRIKAVFEACHDPKKRENIERDLKAIELLYQNLQLITRDEIQLIIIAIKIINQFGLDEPDLQLLNVLFRMQPLWNHKKLPKFNFDFIKSITIEDKGQLLKVKKVIMALIPELLASPRENKNKLFAEYRGNKEKVHENALLSPSPDPATSDIIDY